jgi:electron transfer flavoprotein alpha subunit
MPDNKGVLVHCESGENGLLPIATELLGCGRKLADDLKQELYAVLIGSNMDSLAKEAIAFGADKAYVVNDPLLKEYQTDSYVFAFQKVIEATTPKIILFGQTAIGRDLTPRLSFRLGIFVAMDCVELSIDTGTQQMLQTKSVYGGNVQAIYTSDSDMQIATVRIKAMSPLDSDTARQGEIIPIEVGLDSSNIRTKLLEIIPEEVEGIKLEDASVIVSGGRGIGSAEGFQQLEELANALKGAVGASRPACDNGWIKDTAQIGITGKIVAPEVYFAVGISGSSQHMSGCSGAKTIIAINKDPDSNIFKVSHYGIVGDWKQLVPAFTGKIKELLAG